MMISSIIQVRRLIKGISFPFMSLRMLPGGKGLSWPNIPQILVLSLASLLDLPMLRGRMEMGRLLLSSSTASLQSLRSPPPSSCSFLGN